MVINTFTDIRELANILNLGGIWRSQLIKMFTSKEVMITTTCYGFSMKCKTSMKNRAIVDAKEGMQVLGLLEGDLWDLVEFPDPLGDKGSILIIFIVA